MVQMLFTAGHACVEGLLADMGAFPMTLLHDLATFACGAVTVWLLLVGRGRYVRHSIIGGRRMESHTQVR